ncbi:hypothetical protein, partial [Neisseria bacilliformis]|uniref:hypothetical protein n=1 Tax=Neisseria bacilliformis TaxID=267212 RepID=UPI003C77E25A
MRGTGRLKSAASRKLWSNKIKDTHRRPGFNPANSLFIRYFAGLKPGLRSILLICIHYKTRRGRSGNAGSV